MMVKMESIEKVSQQHRSLAICAANSNRYLVASQKKRGKLYMEDEGEDPLHIIGG